VTCLGNATLSLLRAKCVSLFFQPIKAWGIEGTDATAAAKGLFDYPVGLSDQPRRNLQTIRVADHERLMLTHD
jgi:hypothetical protein